ncbi:hypothetical protein LAZ67_12003341 [Cordylochernes scorpioides]|uniref:C2H2-type domain-containing protein n=1 Tax=Cordylochernes scorpioides TaxID=51811 RepID=A0ABY6L358_9ARAC|nr:hypothetical protein LAZ67_12003341 [Cordylochernes scorpioides]
MDENKHVLLERCRQLKHRATGQRWKHILFTDKKLFTLEQAHIHQNDSSWSAEVPGTLAIVENTTKIRSQLWYGPVFAPVARLPSLSWIKGSKSTKKGIAATFWKPSYSNGINSTSVMIGRSSINFQAKLTQDWCRAHFPDFITSAELPSYSPDGLGMWSILQARACATSKGLPCKTKYGVVNPEPLRDFSQLLRVSVLQDERLQCDDCGRKFLQKCDLLRHQHTHQGTEPFRCTVCDKGYLRKSDLSTHLRFHRRERPFLCHHCNRGFSQGVVILGETLIDYQQVIHQVVSCRVFPSLDN